MLKIIEQFFDTLYSNFCEEYEYTENTESTETFIFEAIEAFFGEIYPKHYDGNKC